MHRGKILQAFSPHTRAIGDLLADDGLITESELIESQRIQKRNEYAPLGGLLIMMGKVTIEVIEMMVHEQIRHAMKEFQSWTDVNLSFTDKEMKPFERINLGVQEFLPQEIIEVLKTFLTVVMSPFHPRLLKPPLLQTSDMPADHSRFVLFRDARRFIRTLLNSSRYSLVR